MAALRIVLDTNGLLSGIAYPSSIPGRILAAWSRGEIEVVLSEALLEELRRVLPRLVHRHGLKDSEIDELVDILAFKSEIVQPAEGNDPELRDNLDQPVLGTLIEAAGTAGAHYLVTGNKDLLALSDRYPIVSPAAFWERHGGFPD